METLRLTPRSCLGRTHARTHTNTTTRLLSNVPSDKPRLRVHIYGAENCNYTCKSNNNHTLMEGLWLTTMPPRMYDICEAAPWLQMAAAFTVQCQGNHSRAGGFPKTWSRSVNPSHCATRECHWLLAGPSSKGK